MKTILKNATVSLVLLYGACILLAQSQGSLVERITQSLFWSLPASLIIGCLLAYFDSKPLFRKD